GCEFFAGRTIIFTRHSSYTRPARGTIKVQGTWAEGDVASVEIDGDKASYTVTKQDVTVPAGVPDKELYVRGQVARGIEGAILDHKDISKKAAARAAFGEVKVSHVTPGTAGNGIPITVTPDPKSKKPGFLESEKATLEGGGFTDESKSEIITVITHEFGHAFGYPHKCGYHTFEKPEGTSCCMNYFHSWLFKLGTHKDPDAREVLRFTPGKEGKHFCATHTRGIRLGRLEDNPVLWSW